MQMTLLQKAYLWSRGGRTEKDVVEIHGEPNIKMFIPNGYRFYPLPSEHALTSFHLSRKFIKGFLKKYGHR